MSRREELTNYVVQSIERNKEDILNQWNNPGRTSTRHFFIDDLLPEAVAKEIYELFPKEQEKWRQRDTFREKKKTLADLTKAPDLLSDITFAIQAPEVLKVISKLTGIENLEGDPLLYAGGLSMMDNGDFLNPHIDNSHNMDRSLYRKFNALYYISPNWEKSNGGNLELWDLNVSEPVEIESRFNRLVIMETNKDSWHSVNKVNVDYPRCCVSNYYFAKGPQPYPKDYYHVTSFMGRPEETVKRLFSRLDNSARQLVATTLKVSRGKDEINKVN